MSQITREEGRTGPGNITRTQGSTYFNTVQNITYIQKEYPSGNQWEELVPSFEDGVEKSSKEVSDGKEIFQILLEGESFTNPGSYALIPTGLDLSTITIVDAWGWCDYAPGQTAKLYANYFDGAGNFRSYWTGGSAPYRVYIRYTKN